MNWEEAKSYAANLRLSGGEWRLPSRDELLALYSATASEQLTALPGMASGNYWSCTTYQFNNGDAWFVNFSDGHDSWKTKWQNQMMEGDVLNGMRVRCIRGTNLSGRNVSSLTNADANLTRDVPNHLHAFQQTAINYHAFALGRGITVDIEIGVPAYNPKDFGGGDGMVRTLYKRIGNLGHFDRLAINKDFEKKGAVSVRIVPDPEMPMSEKDASGIFNLLASAKGGSFVD